MILLPLYPASLMHSNPQRHKIIHGMHPIEHKDGSIHRTEDVSVEHSVHVISVPLIVAVV